MAFIAHASCWMAACSCSRVRALLGGSSSRRKAVCSASIASAVARGRGARKPYALKPTHSAAMLRVCRGLAALASVASADRSLDTRPLRLLSAPTTL